jgi:hypothetical protein
MRLLPIAPGLDVLTARDDEPRDASENTWRGRGGKRRNYQRDESGLNQSLGIGEIDAHARRIANDFGCGGNGDEKRFGLDRHCIAGAKSSLGVSE